MKKRGFTLVELLVVIAIIGILAGMLFPAIAGALANAKATKLGSNGLEVWKVLFAETTDREQINLSSCWPVSTGSHSGEYANSAEFFKYAGDKTNNWLSGVPLGFLSGPGVTAADDYTNIAPANVGWNLVLDMKSGTAADTPFMFTRNLSDTPSAYVTGSGTSLKDIDELLADANPFGDSQAVIIRWGGSVSILKKKHVDNGSGVDGTLLQKLFNPSGTDKDILATGDTL